MLRKADRGDACGEHGDSTTDLPQKRLHSHVVAGWPHRVAPGAKKAFDRESLATAWNADIRMKNIWKAIDAQLP